ncbi:hypothetical protein PPACK8108_LOCUS17341 [Phakopsora pachyrhizi]|uniref:Uncharacterized protein n=1 Tax=Phakopsora pachyrhizi TaxID=170000 RepID=A0AAV0BCC9_PHAPC|nr:hypothetical protein PPACK8108_LOCUS17341 [Phakopsora pachyrhizi]
MMEARAKSVKYWDRRLAHRIRKPLQPGDLVLVYNKSLESQWGNLFKNRCRWNGPYRIFGQVNNGPYILKELDGTKLARKYAASHIKRFYPRGVTSEEGDLDDEEEDETSTQEEEDELDRIQS